MFTEVTFLYESNSQFSKELVILYMRLRTRTNTFIAIAYTMSIVCGDITTLSIKRNKQS
jgi:hypothetical protein